MAVKFKIKRDDEVVVRTGRDRGKTGRVLRVLRAENRVIVEGVNVVMRHTRPTQTSPGGIIQREAPIHISNVALVDPREGGATRVGHRVLEDGRKVRFAKRSGEIIDV